MTASAPRPTPPVPETIETVHVIGVCGTAMAALAGMFVERGVTVRGSDAMAYPPVSDLLAALGIEILKGYKAENLDDPVDLVVVGNVCRRENPEAEVVRDRQLAHMSLPEVLKTIFIADKTGIVPTGTHGKTTTCSLVAWLLKHAGQDPSYMIGGVPANFGTNYRLGGGDCWVVEGDEYDTAYFDKVPKFWHYPAHIGTINNIEFDHADIYDSIDDIQRVFNEYATRVTGALWVNGEDERAVAAGQHTKARLGTFGLSDTCDAHAVAPRYSAKGTEFELVRHGKSMGTFHSPMWGEHNLRNAIGAILLASEAGLSSDQIGAALPLFKGIAKRQEIKGEVNEIVVIDDFAHHPTALRVTLQALRRRYGKRKIWAAFEAKSNTSRRAVFQHEYSKAFSDADQVILSQPWKKDNLPDEQRLSITQLVDDIARSGTPVELIAEVDDIVAHFAERAEPGDVIVGLSGSNFANFHKKMLDALAQRFQ